MMVGRLVSFWNGIFSGAMLNFQGVSPYNNGNGIKMIIPRKSQGGIMFSRCLEDPCHFIDSYTEQTWNKHGTNLFALKNILLAKLVFTSTVDFLLLS